MEQALKQRLVGAGVIIALGVIVIPVVLDSAGERQLRKIPDAPKPRLQSRPGFVIEEKIELPSEEGKGQIVLAMPKAKKETSPAAKVSKPVSTTTTKNKVVKKTPAAKPVQRKTTPEKKPVVNSSKSKASTSTASKSKTSTVSKAAPVTSVWVVQVGSFTDAQKAIKFREQLLKKKHKAFVEKVRGRSGQNLYRVRVGPVPTNEQASALSDKLKKQGIKGYVTRHP